MKIVADRNIPYLREALAPLGETLWLPGDQITPEVMRDADILLTRTRTRCDARLLADSRCSFVGTATIGTDHIDLDWCRRRGITVVNAPGCNAPAVAQYVLSAVKSIRPSGESLVGLTLGIIGVGNVGSVLDRWARSVGMKTLLNDPPRADREAGFESESLERLAADCDVISIHTPYVTGGDYPTRHLIDGDFIARFKRRPILVNAARGGVMDTAAVIAGLDRGLISAAAVDCWENEPRISVPLLERAAVATPHIAGYSLEGKIRGTSMVLVGLARHLRSHFGMDITPEELTASLPPVAPVPEAVTESMLDYPVIADCIPVSAAGDDPERLAELFERMRNDYRFRPEPHV